MMFGPNIIGGIGSNNLIAWWNNKGTTSGALSVQTKSTTYVSGQEPQTVVSYISFDASKSSEMYGRTSTVQPASLQSLACIKT
jgi:hypothetical protein